MNQMWYVLQKPLRTHRLLLEGLAIQFLAKLSGAADLAPLCSACPEEQRIDRVIDCVEAHSADALTSPSPPASRLANSSALSRLSLAIRYGPR